jgi:hypothetical protein
MPGPKWAWNKLSLGMQEKPLLFGERILILSRNAHHSLPPNQEQQSLQRLQTKGSLWENQSPGRFSSPHQSAFRMREASPRFYPKCQSGPAKLIKFQTMMSG